MRGRRSLGSVVALGMLLGAGHTSADEPSPRDRARLPATITAAVAAGVLAGATGLAFMLDRDPALPSLALTVSPQGGGLVL